MVKHIYTKPSTSTPLHPVVEKSFQVDTVRYPKANQHVRSLDTSRADFFYIATILIQTGIISRFARWSIFIYTNDTVIVFITETPQLVPFSTIVNH